MTCKGQPSRIILIQKAALSTVYVKSVLYCLLHVLFSETQTD